MVDFSCSHDGCLVDGGLDDSSMDDGGMDDRDMDESGSDDRVLDDSGLNDNGLHDRGLHDSELDDSGLHDSGSMITFWIDKQHSSFRASANPLRNSSLWSRSLVLLRQVRSRYKAKSTNRLNRCRMRCMWREVSWQRSAPAHQICKRLSKAHRRGWHSR